jgi:hypothetical protein
VRGRQRRSGGAGRRRRQGDSVQLRESLCLWCGSAVLAEACSTEEEAEAPTRPCAGAEEETETLARTWD